MVSQLKLWAGACSNETSFFSAHNYILNPIRFLPCHKNSATMELVDSSRVHTFFSQRRFLCIWNNHALMTYFLLFKSAGWSHLTTCIISCDKVITFRQFLIHLSIPVELIEKMSRAFIGKQNGSCVSLFFGTLKINITQPFMLAFFLFRCSFSVVYFSYLEKYLIWSQMVQSFIYALVKTFCRFFCVVAARKT